MAERRIIVDGLTLKYKGYFDLEELYKLIDHWIREKAYTKHELEVSEDVYKDGMQVHVEKQPYKKITDYAKYVLDITIDGHHIKDVTLDRNGRKIKLQEGGLKMVITGFLELDYEGRWQEKPMFYFLRAVLDQFVYKVNTERFEAGLVEEVNLLHGMVKGFLNLHRY
ncbi:MAG: hypothetical protein GXP63_00855 [DPANN group archaeon]|nr:hypothetical protein [DPANN group archaeon]